MLPSASQSGLNEQQTARFRRDFPGLDIPWLEREFREWLADKERPGDYAAAFYGFSKGRGRSATSWDGGAIWVGGPDTGSRDRLGMRSVGQSCNRLICRINIRNDNDVTLC
jgi:hypothetical protein